MRTTIRSLAAAALVTGAFGVAVAKLPPAPPMTEEQKAAAAAKAKAAAEAEKAALTRAEDRVAQRYINEQKAKGHPVTPQLPSAGAENGKTAAPAPAAK
jgi:hypothetical protein